MINKAFWNWQYYLRLSSTHQRLTQNRNVWKRRKNMKKVHCYWTTRLAGGLARSGEQMASKHCSLSRCSSPWRADYSPWRVMTDFCRGVRFFTPKTQFSFNPIPNLIGNSTCDGSTTWTSIIHKFYGLSTPLTTKFLSHDLIPMFSKQHQQLHVKFNFRIA